MIFRQVADNASRTLAASLRQSRRLRLDLGDAGEHAAATAYALPS